MKEQIQIRTDRPAREPGRLDLFRRLVASVKEVLVEPKATNSPVLRPRSDESVFQPRKY